MNKLKVLHKKRRNIISGIYISDIILCLVILILLSTFALHQSYQGWIFRYKIVEVISLISSMNGFYLAAGLLLVKRFSGTSLYREIKSKKIVIRGGLFHLFCALASYFYFASSYGYAMIVLGHIYRNYSYLQFINAFILFALFVYFVKSPKPSVGKQKP